MAQGAILIPSNNDLLNVSELRNVIEYEKIVRFRDDVLAGRHPHIKVPVQLASKQAYPSRHVEPSFHTTQTNAAVTPLPITQPGAVGVSHEHNASSSPGHSSNLPPSGYVLATSKPPWSEINPILLEKSDDLIKAEIQLQRQRLERSLREQVEQQRLSAKALLQASESLPDFDISEVLSQALALVYPSVSAVGKQTTDDHRSSSDSFDENTFYSSQHDTPEPPSPITKRHEPIPALVGDVIPAAEPPIKTSSRDGPQTPSRDLSVTATIPPNITRSVARVHSHTSGSAVRQSDPSAPDLYPDPSGLADTNTNTAVAGLSSTSSGIQDKGASTIISNFDKGSAESSRITSPQAVNPAAVHQILDDLIEQVSDKQVACPLIRVHSLSPIAPQPAQVSPIATAKEPPIPGRRISPSEIPPAKVSALRNKPSGISSTDSSHKGARSSEKKKSKRKKRRASSKGIIDIPDSPYIKAEPRSPSPFTSTAAPRPYKKQRNIGQYATEISYDEPRYGAAKDYQERPLEDPREARLPLSYETYNDRYAFEARNAPHYQRRGRDEDDFRQLSGSFVTRRPPERLAMSYPAGEVQPAKAASRSIIDQAFQEEPRYYRESVPRANMHTATDRERSRSPIIHERRSPIPMGPPRQRLRIILDAYGREYIDPNPLPLSGPPVGYRDAEGLYERAPLRAESRRASLERYGDDAILYRRSSPPTLAPRRVVTQPEYALPHVRSYRQREYSVRPVPLPPPEEPPRRQTSHFDEAPREYRSTMSSVRPPGDRYELPRAYAERLGSVRPEPPPREYAASVHPEGRQEVVMQHQREFSARPASSMIRREPLPVADSERYYGTVSQRPPGVAYIERPGAREASVMMYPDDYRRDGWR